ncbi:hypothetical protein PUN28_003977 [Cardiocondyla obscurior]|uniref:Uncharacterized protein n=1 Tax=Cardiocondyla obscurior TaxID=286306 RepID=A0AAW2GNJ3_9HYME
MWLHFVPPCRTPRRLRCRHRVHPHTRWDICGRSKISLFSYRSTSRSVLSEFVECRTLPTMSSVHFPAVFSLSTRSLAIQPTLTRKYNYCRLSRFHCVRNA